MFPVPTAVPVSTGYCHKAYAIWRATYRLVSFTATLLSASFPRYRVRGSIDAVIFLEHDKPGIGEMAHLLRADVVPTTDLPPSTF